MIKVLHNHNCSKSNAILEYLDENGVAFQVIDIVNEPLTKVELKTILKKLNTSVHNIIRKNEQVYKEKYDGKVLTDDQWLDVLAENPSLVQRPILIKGSVAMIGRPLENVKFFIEK